MNPIHTENVQFSESQGFSSIVKSLYIFTPFIVIPVIIYLKIQQYVTIPWGFIYFIIMIETVNIFLGLCGCLTTVVTSNGLYIRFIPYIPYYKSISLKEIESIQIDTSRTNNYSSSIFRSSVSYQIQGAHGVRIKYKKGSMIYIGSQRPEELERALKTIVKLS